MNFLMVDGEGNPNSAAGYKEAVGALFSVAYTLKFMVKKAGVEDYGVMPLEGLWWTADGKVGVPENKDDFLWTMMIMQPEAVTHEMVAAAVGQVREKKGLVGLERVHFERFEEGRSAQILHVGPFATEGPTVARIDAFIAERGGQMAGKHHEIYLTDMTKTVPERLRTVVRHPFVVGG
jgi:hypothetical protein